MLRSESRIRGEDSPRRHRSDGFGRGGRRKKAESLRRAGCAAVEELESRMMLSFPPAPLVPAPGESNLLEQAKKFESKNQLSPLDNFPIPFAVVGQAGGGPTVLVHNNPHSGNGNRVEIDVDANPATGPGGKDVAVEVNTELFLSGVFNPHLLVDIDRLGTAPFASDFEVLVSFPFEAFNAELLPGAPNLFIGYKTTGPAGPDDPGGIAPLQEQIRFIPNVVAGADHAVEIQLNTVGASNPLQFITGHFDGTNLTGILNAAAYAAWVEQPPANITIGLDVTNSAISAAPTPPTQFGFDLSWDASSPTKVVFDYLEEESGALGDSDFNTTVTFDQMPTQEDLSLSLDMVARSLTLSHRANATIGEITVLSERNDGLKIIGTASQVPTELDLTIDPAGTVELDVNANTLDLQLEAVQEGGFLNTDEFLGYDIGYLSLKVTDAPDLTAGYIPATDRFGVQATNPGESIGAIELLLDSDAHYDEDGVLVDLDPYEAGPPPLAPYAGGTGDLPPSYADVPAHHLFSLVDDGSKGTVVARLVHVTEASLDIDADATQLFNLTIGEDAPMQVYIRTTPDSNIIPGHDVEITTDIDVIPAGEVEVRWDGPTDFGYTLVPPAGEEPQGIDSIHSFGHIDNMFFDVDAGDLPPVFDFDFEPDEHLFITAEDGLGGPDTVGHVAVRLWVPDEINSAEGLPDSEALFGAGLPLRDARARVDEIPSFQATWSDDESGTSFDFDTNANDVFLGGVQVKVATQPVLTTALPVASASLDHYASFFDEGVVDGEPGLKTLAAGAFGIDHVSFATDDVLHAITAQYDANEAHRLVVDIESAFGGKYMPGLGTDLNLTIDEVPQQMDLRIHLDPGFVYSASAPIDEISLTGTIDVSNDGDSSDATFVSMLFDDMPAQARFNLIPDAVGIIDGLVDVNADGVVNGDDDGTLGSTTIIDGGIDFNNNGVVDGSDDGILIGFPVINGGFDANRDGVIDGSDDGGVAGAELRMSGPVTEISLHMESTESILGTPYQLLDVALTDLAARFLADWSGPGILVETTDQNGNPTPFGTLTAFLSTSRVAATNAAKLEPFTTVGPTGAGPILGGVPRQKVAYSEYLQEIDNRYYSASGSPSVFSRLHEVYAHGEQLDSGEDHAVFRLDASDNLDIASLKLSGFQKLEARPDDDGGHYELKVPTPGLHPLYLGAGLDDLFITAQIANIPDSQTLDIDTVAGNIHYVAEGDTDPSGIDEIDVYVGPAGVAPDSAEALRAVLKDLPNEVEINWGFGFPSGGVTFDADREFELLFLAQDGSKRLTAGLALEDLHAGYNVDILTFEVVEALTGTFCIGIPTPFGCLGEEVELFEIPSAWELLGFEMGIDNDVDDVNIAANPDKEGVDGFFSLYNFNGSPAALDPAGPAADGGEYIPLLSFLLNDFRLFSVGASLSLDPISPNLIFPLSFNIDGPFFDGNFAFDVWSAANTSEFFTIPIADYDIGFINPPDYTDNTPFHILPINDILEGLGIDHDAVITYDGAHGFDDHFDVFA